MMTNIAHNLAQALLSPYFIAIYWTAPYSEHVSAEACMTCMLWSSVFTGTWFYLPLACIYAQYSDQAQLPNTRFGSTGLDLNEWT